MKRRPWLTMANLHLPAFLFKKMYGTVSKRMVVLIKLPLIFISKEEEKQGCFKRPTDRGTSFRLYFIITLSI